MAKDTEIMAKDTEQIKELKYELGDLTYKMGKQQKITEAANKKLQDAVKAVNDKATEIEKLDG